jgi:hypothetical protein
MTKAADDLEAVRNIAETLESFDNDARERIIRWARERVGMKASTTIQTGGTAAGTTPAPAPLPLPDTSPGGSPSDIRSFVKEKAPKSDVQFAATVAYYYQFKAPENSRKDTITSKDLIEACRQVDRKRPKDVGQVLRDSYRNGLMDRGDKGKFRLNSVGENLVAMTLPGGSQRTSRKSTPARMAKGRRVKKGSRKKR